MQDAVQKKQLAAFFIEHLKNQENKLCVYFKVVILYGNITSRVIVTSRAKLTTLRQAMYKKPDSIK